VKTENPSACVTVSDSAVLPVVPSCVYKVSINPIIQSKPRLISHAQTSTRDNIMTYLVVTPTGLGNIHSS
jgi:hypothetical protein